MLARATLVLFCCVSAAFGVEPCEEAGTLASVDGEVEIQRRGERSWRPAQVEERLCQGDTVRVADRSRAAIQLLNNSVLRLNQNTAITLQKIVDSADDASWLDLDEGTVQSFSRRPQRMQINTRQLKALIDGTEFVVEAEGGRSRLSVLEGRVHVSNRLGSVAVGSGRAVFVESGKAPALSVLQRPRDTVSWALYYPPVLAGLDAASRHAADVSAGTLRRAAEELRRGRPNRALAELDTVPPAARDPQYFVYRASIALAVGRVADAETDIRYALGTDRSHGGAYALRSVIRVAQNRGAEALQDALHANRLEPSAASRIALSYAQQAQFRIEAARDTLLAASREHPSDPLVWARLGEILLMLGDRKGAVAAAERAAALAPDSARAHLVLGYAALTEYRERYAATMFRKTIALSSGNPLARLGLGLARISGGDLAGGRREIEIAVGLDPGSALLRAYLGKAYFEEKRYPLDERQYAIAKSLDPADPTAYLYDGILKQSVNRPIEALHDLEAAAERNDNRAVYRSRLLLDKDRAARTASLGRVMNDLGFAQLGIIESAYSLAMDPASTGGHRYLSDTYRNVRRREISRVSELLQAQLLQDININPLQPSIAATSLNIITMGGPATPGFNEFTPLFERNMAQLNTTGFGGTQNTYGGEGLVTALYDRFSLSAGAYHYNSDGWRDNNGLNQTIVNVLGQAAITPELNFQAEFRRRDSNEGDLAFNFDPDDFIRDKSVGRRQQIGRAGLRYSPTPGSHLLFSYIHGNAAEDLVQSAPFDAATTASLNSRLRTKSDHWEGQYIHQRDDFNVITGFSYTRADWTSPNRIVLTDHGTGSTETFTGTATAPIDSPHGYVYTNVRYPEAATWTVGFSYDAYREADRETNSFNPKLGLQWLINKDLLFRAAAFKVLKPAWANSRTIEPTQIAGFNQFFDDVDAARSTRYGSGFKWQALRDLFVGGEVTWRYLAEPVAVDELQGTSSLQFENRKEAVHNLFLYWTPLEQWAFKAEFIYDRYDSAQGITTETGAIPRHVETFSVPLAVNFFSPTGFFAGLGGSFVDQSVDRALMTGNNAGRDRFFLVDAAVGYRFPKRLGILDLSVRNLFDTRFRYLDDSFREFRGEPSIGPYFPVRMFLARLTVIF